jgi:hypothetical protein
MLDRCVDPLRPQRLSDAGRGRPREVAIPHAQGFQQLSFASVDSSGTPILAKCD